ncbi:hypothetical protein Pelo_4921 [Pelomyxa schiedti]|nr:hypothetical protein Pelo_4921 [Pelomyxa schiedti]
MWLTLNQKYKQKPWQENAMASSSRTRKSSGLPKKCGECSRYFDDYISNITKLEGALLENMAKKGHSTNNIKAAP